MEISFKQAEEMLVADPSETNLERLNDLKIQYDSILIISQEGAIIRSRATWHEKGKKSNKYFLGLKAHRGAKSCIRKLFSSNSTVLVNPTKNMKEIENFYSTYLNILFKACRVIQCRHICFKQSYLEFTTLVPFCYLPKLPKGTLVPFRNLMTLQKGTSVPFGNFGRLQKGTLVPFCNLWLPKGTPVPFRNQTKVTKRNISYKKEQSTLQKGT